MCSTIYIRAAKLTDKEQEFSNKSSNEAKKTIFNKMFPTSIKVKFEEFKVWFKENKSSIDKCVSFSRKFYEKFNVKIHDYYFLDRAYPRKI